MNLEQDELVSISRADIVSCNVSLENLKPHDISEIKNILQDKRIVNPVGSTQTPTLTEPEPDTLESGFPQKRKRIRREPSKAHLAARHMITECNQKIISKGLCLQLPTNWQHKQWSRMLRVLLASKSRTMKETHTLHLQPQHQMQQMQR